MQLEIRYLVVILSIILIFGGLYFKFLYDVPDGEETINAWVSWLLVILGIVGIMVSALWKKKINPLSTEDFHDTQYEDSSNVDDDDFRDVGRNRL